MSKLLIEKQIVNCDEPKVPSAKSLKAKQNSMIKEELKAFVHQNYPGYRCTDAFKFQDNSVTGDKTLFFIPENCFISVTKSGGNGSIVADVSRVHLTEMIDDNVI